MLKARQWWPFLVLALIALLPLHGCLEGKAIGAWDQIGQMPPWGKPTEKPFDVLQADSVLEFYPWRDMLRESYAERHQVPLWNTGELAGTPVLSNSQTGALYPPHILAAYLGSTPAMMFFLAWLHLLVAALGMRALLLRFMTTEIGACSAGGMLCLSPFMIGWTALPSVIETCAWIPWILAFSWSLATESKWLRPAAATSLCLGMMFLAGHLQFAFYGLLGSAVAATGFCVVRAAWSKLGVAVGAFILGGAIAAVHLMPVFAYSKFSHRLANPTAEGYAGYIGNAFGGPEWAGIFFPGELGNPGQPNEGAATMTSYWPQFIKRGSSFAESAMSPGPIAFVALAFVAWRRREAWVAIGLGLFGMLLSTDSFLARLFYFYLPGWSATGSPGRASILFVIACCWMAGLGLSELSLGEISKRTRSISLAIIGVALAITGLLVSRDYASWLNPNLPTNLLMQAIKSANIIALAAVAATGVSLFLLRATWRAPALAAIGAAYALISFAWVTIPHGEVLGSVSMPKADRVAAINSQSSFLEARRTLMPPNTARLLHVRELGGYDSLLHRDTVLMLHDICGEDPAPDVNGNMMLIKPRFDLNKLREAGVTHILSMKSLDGLGEPVSFAGFYAYAVPNALGRVSLSSGKADIIEEDFQKIIVQTHGSGHLILRDRNMPGWAATIDGNSASISGTLWKELDLPDGNHRVEFQFVPPGYSQGLIISGVAGSLALLAVALSFGKRRDQL